MAGEKTIENRMIRQAQRKLDALIQDARWDEIDERLTPGQQHAQVKAVLGAEPLVFAGRLLAMAAEAKSKITMQPAEAAKIALMISDRLYGPPDVRIRKGSTQENTFQLEFAWSQPETIEPDAPQLLLEAAQ